MLSSAYVATEAEQGDYSLRHMDSVESESLAKEIADAVQVREAAHMLSDGVVAAFAKALADLKIRGFVFFATQGDRFSTISTPMWLLVSRTPRPRPGTRQNRPTRGSLRDARCSKSISRLNANVAPSSAALAPCFSRVRIRRTPFPKGRPKLQRLAPLPTLRARGPPSDIPWLPDKGSRKRARRDEQTRKRLPGVVAPRLSTAQSVLYRFRFIIFGELAGARVRYEGFGPHICHLAGRREVCVGNAM